MVELAHPIGLEIAQRIVCSAENSSLDWRAMYGYLEDIDDGRGYTGGLIGFCSGTGDLLDVVERYAAMSPGAPLAGFIPALRRVNGTDSHAGLGRAFERAWREAATDPAFRTAQDQIRDEQYVRPAIEAARRDGLRGLGQFMYYDALVMHGPGDDTDSFGGIRAAAHRRHRPPSAGGDERSYLAAFLDVRRHVMRQEEAHADTSRLDTAQAWWLAAGNLDLEPPLRWQVYGDDYAIDTLPDRSAPAGPGGHPGRPDIPGSPAGQANPLHGLLDRWAGGLFGRQPFPGGGSLHPPRVPASHPENAPAARRGLRQADRGS
ncbi:MAG TPA: chitosanase [Kineosporiaceae bacterium]|nr:chitosanase [Kineosporiaceae bacterium]